MKIKRLENPNFIFRLTLWKLMTFMCNGNHRFNIKIKDATSRNAYNYDSIHLQSSIRLKLGLSIAHNHPLFVSDN